VGGEGGGINNSPVPTTGVKDLICRKSETPLPLPPTSPSLGDCGVRTGSKRLNSKV